MRFNIAKPDFAFFISIHANLDKVLRDHCYQSYKAMSLEFYESKKAFYLIFLFTPVTLL